LDAYNRILTPEAIHQIRRAEMSLLTGNASSSLCMHIATYNMIDSITCT